MSFVPTPALLGTNLGEDAKNGWLALDNGRERRKHFVLVFFRNTFLKVFCRELNASWMSPQRRKSSGKEAAILQFPPRYLCYARLT